MKALTLPSCRFLARAARPGLAFALLTACQNRPPAVPPETRAPNRPAVAAQEAPAPAVLPTTDVDLIPRGLVKLAVSSVADNATDFASHLIDGRTETAWVSAPGALEASIELTVPSDARVTEIVLDTRPPQDARFAAYQRVGRARLLRKGTVLGEYEVDPAHGLITIPVHGSGGAYRVELVGMQAGSAASTSSQRSLFVAECRVLGTLAETRPGPSPKPPQVLVGSLDARPLDVPLPPPTLVREAYPTLSALCAASVKANAATFEAQRKGAQEELDKLKKGEFAPHRAEEYRKWQSARPACKEVAFTTRFEPHGSPWSAMHAIEVSSFDHRATHLVGKSSRGFVELPIEWNLSAETEGGPVRPETPIVPDSLSEIRPEGAQLLVSVDYLAPYWTDDDAYCPKPGECTRYEWAWRGVTRCEERPEGVTCQVYRPQEGMPLGRRRRVPGQKWQGIPWKEEHAFAFDGNTLHVSSGVQWLRAPGKAD
jgi:hypothetical protein